ncbi:hypothetical protein [Bacillus sp. EAC]|uniref:hypothetical protein n=1 Tax=Bacillus sp. EAC TaxID=1978338 RepID=UPI000B43B030|nr:hypothetical protein [Bacillus sp. EAC]
MASKIRKIRNIFIAIVILFSLFVGGKYVLNLFLEFGDMCGNEIIQKVPSPSLEKDAYIFIRNCGATTAESYQLSILNKDDKLPNDSGNTFVSDNKFKIDWLNERGLRVNYDENSETYKKDESVNGIKIRYIGK